MRKCFNWIIQLETGIEITRGKVGIWKLKWGKIPKEKNSKYWQTLALKRTHEQIITEELITVQDKWDRSGILFPFISQDIEGDLKIDIKKCVKDNINSSPSNLPEGITAENFINWNYVTMNRRPEFSGYMYTCID